MSSRKVIDFMLTPSGKFLSFGALVLVGCLAFNYYKSLPDSHTKKKDIEGFHNEIDIKRTMSKFSDRLDNREKESREIFTTASGENYVRGSNAAGALYTRPITVEEEIEIKKRIIEDRKIAARNSSDSAGFVAWDSEDPTSSVSSIENIINEKNIIGKKSKKTTPSQVQQEKLKELELALVEERVKNKVLEAEAVK